MTVQPNSGTQHVIGHKSFQQYIPSNSSAWDGLAKWLPTRDENSSWWWKSTGRQLATVLADGGYELSQQYEALLFHYRMVVPWLGARPTSVKPKWKSFMTDDFSPIEYSWKWAKDCKGPEVRYGVEPLSLYAGSSLDPLNQMPTRALLQQVRQVMPDDIDLTWFDHFLRSIFGGETTSPVPGQGTQNRSSLFLAFELVRNRIAVKAYFIPVELPGGLSAAEQIAVAIQSAPEMNNMRAYDAIQIMESYLRDDPAGATLTPFMLGIDCVNPAESRLKVYVRSPRTSFEFVRNVMTLGGRRGVQGEFDDVAAQFHDLWNLTLGLDPEAPADRDLPKHKHVTAGTCFYFDVGPQSTVPDVKAYIPVRHYACSDRQVALGLTRFLAKHGRAGYARKYMQTVESLAVKPGAVDAATGVQTYISCAYKSGYVCMTSYLSPQVYHAARWGEGLGL